MDRYAFVQSRNSGMSIISADRSQSISLCLPSAEGFVRITARKLIFQTVGIRKSGRNLKHERQSVHLPIHAQTVRLWRQLILSLAASEVQRIIVLVVILFWVIQITDTWFQCNAGMRKIFQCVEPPLLILHQHRRIVFHPAQKFPQFSGCHK